MSRPTESDRKRVNILKALYKESDGHASNVGGAAACSECGCLEIEGTAWIGRNTNEVNPGDGPSGEIWCPDCETSTDDGECILVVRAGRIWCESHDGHDCKAARNIHRGTKWDEEPKAAQS